MIEKSPLDQIKILSQDLDDISTADLINLTASSISPGSRVTLYVNNASGHDENAGTQDAPLKTLAAAVGLIPAVVTRPYYIRLIGTGTAYDGACLSRQFIMAGGELVICGETINTLYTGTVTTGGQRTFSDSALSLTTDELVGSYVRFPTTVGANPEILNWCCSIVANDATQLTLARRTWNISVGDTYEVFEPDVQIDLTDRRVGGSVMNQIGHVLGNNTGFNIDQGQYSFTFANVVLNCVQASSATYFEGDVDFLGVKIIGNSSPYFSGYTRCGATSKDVLNLNEENSGARGYGLTVDDFVFLFLFGGKKYLDGLVVLGGATFIQECFAKFGGCRLCSSLTLRNGTSCVFGISGSASNGESIIRALPGGDPIDVGITVNPGCSLTYELTGDIDISATAGSVGILCRGSATLKNVPIDADLYAVQACPGATVYIDGNGSNHTVNGSNTSAYAAGRATPTTGDSGGSGVLATDLASLVNTSELAIITRDNSL